MIFEKKIKPNIKIFPVPAVVERNIKDQPFFHIKLIVSEYLKVIYTIIFIRWYTFEIYFFTLLFIFGP